MASPPPPLSLDLPTFEKLLRTALTKLPSSEEYEFHALSQIYGTTFAERTVGLRRRVGSAMVELAKRNGVELTMNEDSAVVDEEAVKRATAILRERANLTLDNLLGLSAKEVTVAPAAANSNYASSKKVIKNANLTQKPQEFFYDWPIDNSRETPFRPPPFKHLAKKDDDKRDVSVNVMRHIANMKASTATTTTSSPDNEPHLNPYKREIKAATKNLPDWMLLPIPKFLPVRRKNGNSLTTIPFEIVETASQFEAMLEHLSLARHDAIAIDLEHHAHRSFQGFTCVIQISTWERDYVVDALALRKEIPRLSPIFLNKNVVKVLHGSDYDVEWLQKDFGLYLVNMFDTGQAARYLSYPSASLAYALNKHAQVNPNKAYRLSDWRMRPMTLEMIEYAREDTHWLLSVFDLIRIELLKPASSSSSTTVAGGGPENVVEIVRRSAAIAGKSYAKPQFAIEEAIKLIDDAEKEEGEEEEDSGHRHRRWDEIQIEVLKSLYDWRDATARELDESVHYVMTNRVLATLAKRLGKITDEDKIPSALLVGLRGGGQQHSTIAKDRMEELVILVVDAARRARARLPSSDIVVESEEEEEVPVTVPPSPAPALVEFKPQDGVLHMSFGFNNFPIVNVDLRLSAVHLGRSSSPAPRRDLVPSSSSSAAAADERSTIADLLASASLSTSSSSDVDRIKTDIQAMLKAAHEHAVKSMTVEEVAIADASPPAEETTTTTAKKKREYPKPMMGSSSSSLTWDLTDGLKNKRQKSPSGEVESVADFTFPSLFSIAPEDGTDKKGKKSHPQSTSGVADQILNDAMGASSSSSETPPPPTTSTTKSTTKKANPYLMKVSSGLKSMTYVPKKR